MNNKTIMKVAKDLDAYLRARAEYEGRQCNLSPEFFADHIRAGICEFFGIHYDQQGLTRDDQQPDFFVQYHRIITN